MTGPSNGDLYVGPALDILDRALAWCKHLGLQAPVFAADAHRFSRGIRAFCPQKTRKIRKKQGDVLNLRLNLPKDGCPKANQRDWSDLGLHPARPPCLWLVHLESESDGCLW